MAKENKKELAVVTKLEEESVRVPETIKNEDELLAAGDLILKVRKKYTEIDGHRKERTAPANETIKLINEDYKSLLDPLAGLEKRLKGAIEVFANEKIQTDLEKLANLRKETGDKQLMIPIGFKSLPSVSGEVRFRKTFEIRIKDPKKVPKEYVAVDMKAIQKIVDATEGDIKIPGVEIVPATSIALYTN